jgi:hypothetical protein
MVGWLDGWMVWMVWMVKWLELDGWMVGWLNDLMVKCMHSLWSLLLFLVTSSG